MHIMRVSVIGGGYVGLVTGACLASRNTEVTIIDCDPTKVAAINRKEPPIYEEGLQEILKDCVGVTLSASETYDSVPDADLIYVCVGTPEGADGSADLSYIRQAATEAGRRMQESRKYQVLVVKSTVPPGTVEYIVKPAVLAASGKAEGEIGFGMNPEFLREGRAVRDFLNPDRIVLGADSDDAYCRMASLYESFDVPQIRTSLVAAEMIKYTSNAFLATKISFSNEIGNICKQLGLDVYEVMAAVGLDSRIGPLFLNAGAGFGGSCFPKDVMALVHLAAAAGVDPIILKAVLAVNDSQPGRMIRLLQERCGDLAGKRIAVLGLAFKDNTDDIRESRAIPAIQLLKDAGAYVTAYDPMAATAMSQVFPDIEYCMTAAAALSGADGALIMTEWPEFCTLSEEFSLMKRQIIIDGRHMVTGPGVEGVCW